MAQKMDDFFFAWRLAECNSFLQPIRGKYNLCRGGDEFVLSSELLNLGKPLSHEAYYLYLDINGLVDTSGLCTRIRFVVELNLKIIPLYTNIVSQRILL